MTPPKRRHRGPTPPRQWQPLGPAQVRLDAAQVAYMEAAGMPLAIECWKNDLYQVTVRRQHKRCGRCGLVIERMAPNDHMEAWVYQDAYGYTECVGAPWNGPDIDSVPEKWGGPFDGEHEPLVTTDGTGDDCVVHLSIHRNDRRPIRDWRDMQRIKNQLAGPEAEAVELYPAQSRVVDTANEFHLWCLPPGMAMPLGWTGPGLVAALEDHDDAVRAASPNAVQRPPEPIDLPDPQPVDDLGGWRR